MFSHLSWPGRLFISAPEAHISARDTISFGAKTKKKIFSIEEHEPRVHRSDHLMDFQPSCHPVDTSSVDLRSGLQAGEASEGISSGKPLLILLDTKTL